MNRPSTAIVPIREIDAEYRPQVLDHLLALNDHDRYFRFGYTASDDQIRKHVEGIDFERDQMFGIFDRHLALIAIAHLAMPAAGTKHHTAEFAVSVAAHARGRGYGKGLYTRAAVYAINHGIETLYVHVLSQNTAMLHIARDAGSTIEHCEGESEGHLRLPAADGLTRMSELLSNQVGDMDYWLKWEASNMRKMPENLPGLRTPTPTAQNN